MTAKPLTPEIIKPSATMVLTMYVKQNVSLYSMGDDLNHLSVGNWWQMQIFSFPQHSSTPRWLTHWGRVTHICVAYLTIIVSDNGLSPSRRQAIIWTNAGILLIRSLGTNFSEILIEIHTFSFKEMHLKMSSAKRQPFCLGLNVLIYPGPQLQS